MAESMNVSGPTSNRLKDYKQLAKEPEEVKSTRKLVEGINLRRNQREKKFAERRTLGPDKDCQSLDVDVGNVTGKNDNLNVKQKVPPSLHPEPFPVQPPSLLQGPLQGPSTVGQGLLQLQSPLPLQGLPQGLSAVGQGLLPVFPTSLPPGPHQGLLPLMPQNQILPMLHPEPVQHQGLLGEESAEKEDTEQEQYIDNTDESECDDVEDYVSEEDKRLKEEMKEKAKALYSETEDDLLEGVVYFRNYLDQDYPEPSYVVEVGILPRLVKLLSDTRDPILRFEVSCVLMHIASGYNDCSEAIIEAGGVPVLVEHITLENHEISENALWALGYIAANGAGAREDVLRHGLVPALLKFSEDPNQLSADTLQALSSVILSVFRSKPHCSVETVVPLLGLMKEIIPSTRVEIVLDYFYTALSHISDGDKDLIQAVVDSGIYQILFDHFDGSRRSAVAAMTTFVNIASGNDANIQSLLDLNILKFLEPLIKEQKYNSDLMVQVYRLLSKILAGTQQQIQVVIDSIFMESIMECLSSNYFSLIKEQCIWCVCNLLSRGNPDQRRYAVTQGCIAPLCAGIGKGNFFSMQFDTKFAILQAFQSLIKDSCDPDAEYYISVVEESGGLDKIKEEAQGHFQHHIVELSRSVIELFTRRKEQRDK